MSEEREYIKKQREKWLAERELEKKLNSVGIDNSVFNKNEKNSKFLTEITLKISEKLQKELSLQKNPEKNVNMKIEKTISKEIETNTCPVCYELMVPPKNSPILLFPCGHTFCKMCVYTNHSKQTIQKCPCCRAQVKSSALNISLQNLICVFTNNKHLIDKYDNNIQEEKKEIGENSAVYKENLKMCNIRCKILKDEISDLKMKNSTINQNITGQQAVLNELYQEKKKVKEKIEKLTEEFKLINDYIDKNEDELKLVEKELSDNLEKIKLIEDTLVPLQNDKEKYEILIKNLK